MSYSLSLSKAFLVVIFVSDKIRQGQFEYLSAKNISEKLNIPRPTLVKILQNLARAGIMETKEGKNGGIRMAKLPSEVSLLEIFNAMEQEKSLFQTSFNILAEGKRPDNAQKVVSSLLNRAELEMKSTLASKNIQHILDEMGG